MKRIAIQLNSGDEKAEAAAYKSLFRIFLARTLLQVIPILIIIFFTLPDMVVAFLKVFSTFQFLLLVYALGSLLFHGYAVAFGRFTGIGVAKVGMSLDFFVIFITELVIIGLFGVMQVGVWFSTKI